MKSQQLQQSDPWRVELNVRGIWLMQIDGDTILVQTDKHCIAVIGQAAMDSENLPHAHLISAAPDLLEAAQMALELLNNQYQKELDEVNWLNHCMPDPTPHPVMPPEMIKLLSAINKALNNENSK